MTLPDLRWRSLSLLPIGLAAFHVLRFYVESGVSIFAVTRSLIVAIGSAVVVWILVSAIVRDTRKSTVLVTFAVLAFVSANPATVVLIAVLLGATTLIAPRLLRVAFPWRLVIPAGNWLSLMLLVVLMASAAVNGTLAQLPRDVGWAVAGARAAVTRDPTSASSAVPDIYILMLEDYPRADELDRLFHFDSTPFLHDLTQRGFTVSPKSRANYSNSALTVLTMFEGRHVADIPELSGLPPSFGNAFPAIRSALNDGAMLERLRSHGYEIVAAASGYEQFTLRAADRFFDNGELSEFEFQVLDTTAFARYDARWLLDLVGDELRARVRGELAFLQATARSPSPDPRVVFVHVPTPHAPIMFSATGDPVQIQGNPFQFDLSDRERFIAQYDAQLEYLHRLVIATLDGLSGGSRPAVTILMSDEGLGWFNAAFDPDPTTRPLLLLGNLFAARTPDRTDLFGPAPTPVNVFPILLNHYLGEEIPLQSDVGFLARDTHPFDRTEIPNTDASAP